MREPTLEARFWSKVDKSAGPDGCWTWTAYRNNLGYGRFFLLVQGRHRYVGAHRLAYELLVGPIPDDLVLDHLCRNPPCVNPAHLEVVTQQENLLRGNGASGRNARKTHCPQGHEYTPENTRINTGPGGGRMCRACHREDTRRRKAAARAAKPQRPAKTHCIHGHEYTPENTYIYRGARCCRACAREKAARRYAARKATAALATPPATN